MLLRTTFVLLAILGLLAGCREPSVGMSTRKQPKAYANIVSLSPSTTEILVGFGGHNYLVGRTASCDRPPAALGAKIVVPQMRPDEEVILALDPDLIIYDRSLYSEDEIARIKGFGVEMLEYNPSTIADYARFVHVLASKLGMETSMGKQVDFVYDALEAARSHPTSNPRTTVLLGDGKSENYLVLGKRSFHAHILRECGAEPVGVDGKPFAQVNIEALIDWDPEVIYSDGHAFDIYNDARLQSVSAVKNGRVYDIDARTIVRIGDQAEELIKRFDYDLHRLPVNRPQAPAQ